MTQAITTNIKRVATEKAVAAETIVIAQQPNPMFREKDRRAAEQAGKSPPDYSIKAAYPQL